jgi:hypothetical protein
MKLGIKSKLNKLELPINKLFKIQMIIKKLLPLIFALFVIQTNAQTSVYHSFPDSNAVWTIGSNACCWSYCPPPPSLNPVVAESNFSYTLTGDTVINTLTYHKVWKSGTRHEHCATGGTLNNWSIINYCVGAYREDTAVKKVYFYDNNYSQEFLLYDFSLNVGDTLEGMMSPLYGYAIVSSIDSVLVGSNFRKKINHSSGSWIEGIGSTSGLLENFSGPDEFSNLVCFKHKVTEIYPDTISACDILTQMKEIRVKSAFSIAPNPIHTYATIQAGNEFINSELIIYNLFGQQVKTQMIYENSIRIERDGLNAGIYFYRAVNSKGKTASGKIVIE